MADLEKSSRLRLFFLRGLGALLPTILTIVILVFCYRFVRDNIATPINQGIHTVLINTDWGRGFLDRYCGIQFNVERMTYIIPPDPEEVSYKDPDTRKPNREVLFKVLSERVHPVLGFAIAILLIFFLGFLLATYFGRRIFRLFERLLSNIPVVKIIYPHVKQLVEFFFKDKKIEFSSVVAIEYPRKGLYSLGLLTGEGLKQLHKASGARLVSVFVPSSPMPMTGYTIFVPYEDLTFIDLEVDEALRLVLTGGVVVPAHQVVALSRDKAALEDARGEPRPAIPRPPPTGRKVEPSKRPVQQ